MIEKNKKKRWIWECR